MEIFTLVLKNKLPDKYRDRIKRSVYNYYLVDLTEEECLEISSNITKGYFDYLYFGNDYTIIYYIMKQESGIRSYIGLDLKKSFNVYNSIKGLEKYYTANAKKLNKLDEYKFIESIIHYLAKIAINDVLIIR